MVYLLTASLLNTAILLVSTCAASVESIMNFALPMEMAKGRIAIEFELVEFNLRHCKEVHADAVPTGRIAARGDAPASY